MGTLLRILEAEGPALDPFGRVLGGQEIRGGGLAVGVVAGPDPRFVHHVKHHGKPPRASLLVGERPHADAVTGIVLPEIEEGRRLGVEPHLMLQADRGDVVGRPEAPVLVDPDLRDDVQADPRRAGRASLGAGQDHVDRVLADPRVAGGDEHLRALDPVDQRIVGRKGAGGYVADIGAGVRLGQAHGPLPVAAEHLRQEEGPVTLRTEQDDQIRRAAGELDVGRYRRTGRRVHLVDHLVEDERHPPFDPDAFAARAPAVGLEEFVRLRISRRRRDDAVFQLDPRLVARGVDRGDNPAGDLVSFAQVRIAIIDAEVVLEPLAGEHLRGGQPFLDDELEISGVVPEFHESRPLEAVKN